MICKLDTIFVTFSLKKCSGLHTSKFSSQKFVVLFNGSFLLHLIARITTTLFFYKHSVNLTQPQLCLRFLLFLNNRPIVLPKNASLSMLINVMLIKKKECMAKSNKITCNDILLCNHVYIHNNPKQGSISVKQLNIILYLL